MERWEETGPVPGHIAFNRNDPSAVHSQAAFLLALAHHGRRGMPDPQGQFINYPDERDEYAVDSEDAELLALPDWPHPLVGTELIATRTRLLERFSGTNANLWSPKADRGNESGLATALYDDPGAEAFLNLIHACLYSAHSLVRVAAAGADLHLDLLCHDWVRAPVFLYPDSTYVLDPLVRVGAARADETFDHPDHSAAPAHLPLPRQSIEILMRGAGAQDELVRDVAVSALEGARFHFESHLQQDSMPAESTDDDRPAPGLPRTSVLIHGTTFGRTPGWWQPGRVFPKYLKANVSSNLYSGSKPFLWSGLYSYRARQLGADDLVRWANGHSLDHVFAYSHGGSVAMLASALGVSTDKLVLLSCPVHSHYAPDFQRAPNVVSVRTRLDLVILADGGGQRFRDRRIVEHVLPIWFTGHKATRQPDVWRRHNIDAML